MRIVTVKFLLWQIVFSPIWGWHQIVSLGMEKKLTKENIMKDPDSVAKITTDSFKLIHLFGL